MIGRGSPGGKGAGLLRIQSILSGFYPDGNCGGISVGVPETVILLSDVFELFVKENNLDPEYAAAGTDQQTALKFRMASFPALIVGEIRSIFNGASGPLAVRSSSLTEDSLEIPLAGLFATKMIPNNHPDPNIRFMQLIEAVKFIYASTWFRGARDGFRAAGIDINTEKMAVVIQKVHGVQHGQFFYPMFSGVGRSFNHYPFNGCSRESGIVELAAGLGKTIVDGGRKWLYSPEKPGAPPPASIKDLLDSGQVNLWTINLNPPDKQNPFSETEYMSLQPLKRLEQDGQIDALCSTYSAESDRLEMGYRKNGFKLIDFSPVLRGRLFDFNSCISGLMQVFRNRTGSEIEIEFAVNKKPGGESAADLALLQIRPMKKILSADIPPIENPDKNRMIVYSDTVMGNVFLEGIEDFVYIHPSDFSPLNTVQMSAEIEYINRNLIYKDRSYILSGFGRWGTSDPALGIPVKWPQISGACLIIESTLPDMNPELSQGSHFFHNILNTGTAYMSVENRGREAEAFIDYEYLEAQAEIFRGTFFRHVVLDKSVRVIVDGNSRKGAVLK